MFHQILHSWSPGRFKCKHLLDDLEYFIGVVRGDSINLSKFNLVSKLDLIGGFEGCSKGEHLVDDTASGPNVRFFIISLLLDLFGAHVIRRADMRISKD